MHVIEVREIFTFADIAVQDKKHIFANTLFLLFFSARSMFWLPYDGIMQRCSHITSV